MKMNKIQLSAVTGLAILLLSSCGSSPSETAANPGSANAPAAAPGEAVYKKTCVTCHQANGEGLPNTFPPLAKSDYLSDKEKTILQVLKGSAGEIVVNGKTFNSTMPPQQLSDEEIASVLTYVYGNFGNSGVTISPAEVKGLRAKL
jgi:nitrite reductase (NO-forming)